MKIIDILNRDITSLSFEVFPPKKESSIESVKLATEKIGELKPSYMSVTYGAGGGVSNHTLDIAKNLMDKYDVPLLAHLTCVSSDKKFVAEKIMALKDAGIKNIMALRGDIPENASESDKKNWEYHYAIELIRQLRESNEDFCIGAACYPEVHPESSSQNEDVRYLKEKVDAGVDFLTTQMFFDNNLFFNYMYKIRERGISIPVVPGIMPITNANQVERAIKLSGSFMPRRFTVLVDKFGHDPDAMRQAGIAYAVDQIIDLYTNGITNVHVYSMNKPDVASGIMNSISDILGKKYV